MLKIRHISKTFNPGTINEKKAITDLSLELKKGDFATIIGSNGAGKSTLFNAICGDFFTDSGSIELDGRDITFTPQHARARSIGRLYQDPMRGTAPGMTIEENLALAAGKGGWLSHVTHQEKERFHEELKLLDIGLEARMSQPVGLLSGGQRQRLALARALLHDSPVYIFDEATSNIDVESEELIMDVIRQLAETKTVLLISHRLANVVSSDCICMLENGLIREQGTHQQLVELNGSYCKLYESQQQLEKWSEDRKGQCHE